MDKNLKLYWFSYYAYVYILSF